VTSHPLLDSPEAGCHSYLNTGPAETFLRTCEEHLRETVLQKS
jgi:hypothetical protein